MQTILAYTQLGEGKDLLLVHGFGESKQMWKDFVPVLATHFRVTALDLGGFGESQDLLPLPCSLEALAEQVDALVRHLEIEKFAWVGHSLGGYVGLAYIEKYAHKLTALSLFHSTALADTEEKKKIRENVVNFIDKNGVAPFIENFVAPLFFETRHQELETSIAFIKNIALCTPKATLIEVMRAMRNRPDRTELLANANFPVQFIIGRQDNSVPFDSYAAQIVLPKNVDVQVLDQTGHMGMFERPELTKQALIGFLQRQYP